MKKYLLFIISMLCVSIGAWADLVITYDDANRAMGIETKGDAALAALSETTVDQWNNNFWSQLADNRRTLNIVGDLSQEGINKIQSCFSSYYTGNALQLNLSNITLSGSITSLPTTNKINTVVLPNGTDLSSIRVGDNINYIYSGDSGNGIISIYVASGSTTVTELTPSVINSATTINIYGPGANDYATTNASSLSGKTVNIPFTGNLTVAGDGIETNITTALTPYSAAIGDIVNLAVTGTLTSDDVTWLDTNKSNLTGLTTLDLTGATFGADVTKASVAAAVRTGVTVQYPASYTITDGCTVTIDTGKLLGEDFATVLAQAKAAVVAGGQSAICTLIVSGEITNQNLAALADAAMTGATRIDLSAATLASGASINNLRVPASLTQLVLPCDQTVSSTLATRLAAVTGLGYAYSPSSDAQRLGASSTGSYDKTRNKIADYVWVVKAGGLAQAFTNEEWLRNSFYIKVASSVALNATDVNFNALDTKKPTNYLFLDFSGSNLTPEMAANYRVTDQIGYRIILPDNWTNAQMAVFANMGTTERGSLAAVYSYEGSKLNILVIDNASYNGTALKNPRIVRSGTDAIEILPGTYEGNHPFGPYSEDNDNDGVTDGIISAINNAQASIKSVIINIGNTANNSNGGPYNFTNPNMTYLSLEGIKSYYNPAEGPNITISNASSLQTLNLKNASLWTVTATGLTSLETVDMTGTIVVNATDLSSNSSLNTLTTTSDTQFKGNLNLTSSALTSFATPAKVTGHIYLNASTSLTSVDLTQTDFKSTTSEIHIDKETTEGTEALVALAKTETVGESQVAVKTIFVPNGFASSTRIHPYDAVKNNIGEAAGSSAGVDGDNCSITYDATTKVATVHTNEPGHFANMMASAYASYPQGTTFKFDATSKINMADLQALAGTINSADYSWRSNYYYVDLYDLPASEDLCNTPSTENPDAKGAIYKTIEWLRANDRQFKGLILPKDHTLYGSGTTLIKDGAGTTTNLATCSEFIAYYKTKEMKSGSATNLDEQLLVAHVYNQSNSSSAYQASFDKMKSMLDTHAEIATDADLYLISTNSINKIDVSALPKKTIIETINNEMVGTATTASIYAYPEQPGSFATAVSATSLQNTPTELLVIDGNFNGTDITAINSFDTNKTADKKDGPRVLDLSKLSATQVASYIGSLKNKDIEFIILPAGMTKAQVNAVGTNSELTSLKTVISSNSTDLVAYVNTPGSLAEARYLATGGAVDAETGLITPTQTGLKSVTLSGYLNAADIGANLTTHQIGADGHWNSDGDLPSIALSQEQGTITKIDLEKAIFPTKTDMNFSWAGLGSISDITLPTATEMDLIPAECFMGITSFDNLCIPYNYKKIDDAALYGTYCGHITTTDANGALIDNGEHSYTFSNNLEDIGTQPTTADENGVYSLSRTVFPQNRGVTDVYVRAHRVPKCYANAFPANMLYGWGGFKGGDFPYCREKYDNSSDGSMIFTVLHFPDEASFTANKNLGGKTENDYATMKKLYTDVNKVYSKKEQTGAVDANGDAIAWPTFAELRRAYNQATDGITWNDWTLTKDATDEVVGGEQIPTAKNAIAAGPGTGTYPFSGYEGWHQFTLSLATYVEPSKTIVDEVIQNKYVEAGWYTLCVPFNITEDQLIAILGVPASTATVESYIGAEKITSDKLPDLRTLQTVTRTPGTTQNKVTLKFTNDLTNGNNYQYWNINYVSPNLSAPSGCGALTNGAKIAIKGGHPYLVKPYLPEGETVKNLGKYIITRYGKMFTSEQSCIYNDNCYEDLVKNSGTNKTGRFAKPFEGHKIQAYLDVDNSKKGYTTHSDGTNYYYTFVGQFWDQKLPQYSFYMVENNTNAGTWYWYSSGTKNYTWAAYKCVIMVTQENDDTSSHPTSGKYRNNGESSYPVSTGTDADGGYKFTEQLYIKFLDGLDDTQDFSSAAPKHIFTLDNFDIELDGDETTAINTLDGVDLRQNATNGRVYNMEGQYVGNSLEGLAKGMYIVNGKKVLVK